jgi:hypothetical protein
MDHGGERFCRPASGLEKAGEARALAELGGWERRSRPGTAAVARRQPLRALLAIGGAGELTHLQLHQALGSEADHLAQEAGVRGLTSARRLIISSLIDGLSVRLAQQPDPTGTVDGRREAARLPA